MSSPPDADAAAAADVALYVKICGLRTAEAVAAAVDAGADAVGFVLAEGSPRTTDPATVRALVAAVPEAIDTVGVFRRQPVEEVLRMALDAGVGAVQLHGGEPEGDFERLEAEGLRTIRALGVDEYAALVRAGTTLDPSRPLLIDAPQPGAGVTFDASALSGIRPGGMWLLAGGLHPGNVATAIRDLRPHGVDVSSGVESVRGVKDPALIRAFVEAARAA